MEQSDYRKEKRRELSTTDEEMNAWEALRREPGLMGRLARRGKHMKRDYVGGKRSFQPPGRSSQQSYDSRREGKEWYEGDSTSAASHQAAMQDQRNRSAAQEAKGGGGGGDGGAAARAAAAEAARKAAEKAALKAEEDKMGKKRQHYAEGTMKDAEGRVEGEEGYDETTATLDTEGTLEGARRDYKGLRERADFSETRGELKGYQTEADKLRGEAAGKFGGYESQISQMPDRAAQVAGYGEDVAGLRAGVGEDVTAGKAGMQTAREEATAAGGQLRGMATEARDTGALMKDRGLFAGQIEAQRKAKRKGSKANLRRSMAASGASPQEIARAEAEMDVGGGQSAREDAIAASMASMQSGRQGLSQAAGMTGQAMSASNMQAQMAGRQAALGMQGAGQQAQFAGQAAGMSGQAQNLGLQRVGAQSGMYQQGLQAQTGLMQMGGNLAQARQGSLQGELAQQRGLTGDMAGITRDQMGNVVDIQKDARQERLGREGIDVQNAANAANRPQGPTQQEQVMDVVKTGAMVKVAMACIPEGTKIDTPDGVVPIEEIKAGNFVIGMDGKDDEVLQVHQYKEDPEPARFATITFDDGSIVNCCDKHRISNKRTEDYRLHDKIGSREVTGVEWYNGVNRSYDILTATGGYRINGVPVNTMIPEMAETIVELNNKLAA